MKRIIITCLMAVGVWLTAQAVNTVTLTSVQGRPGDEVEIAVNLSNNDEVTAFEIQVPLADMLRYVDGSAILNAERSNGHTLTASAQDGKLSICVYSLSLAPIKGTDGEVCRFKVKLGKEPADYDLVPEVVMSDKSGTSLDCSVGRGVVKLLSPKIEIITPTLAYGRVPIRSSYTKTLTIRNSGNEPLEISDIDFDADDLSASPATCSIAAGTAKDIIVTYSPMQRGDVTKNVTITSNAINPKAGKAVVTAQPYSVNQLHVQRVEGISDEEVTVVLKMNNMEPIAGAQCSFKMPKELVYVEGSASAGAMCANTGHVALGSLQGDVLTLMLYSTTNSVIPEGNGELMTFRVRLDGRSGSYRLTPTDVILGNVDMENMVSETTANYVAIKSPAYSGSAVLNMGESSLKEKKTSSYFINNQGTVDLVISKVTFLSEGYSVETELPMTIAARTTQGINVSYTPSMSGDHGTTMQIYTNDPNNRMFSVAVSGHAYEPNTITVRGAKGKNGYSFAFGLDNYTDIVAVQMNVSWVANMKTSNESFKPTDRIKNHSYLVTDLGNGTYQVLIYSMNNTPISGNEGDLFTLDYMSIDGKEYSDVVLQVKDIVLSDAKGNNHSSIDVVDSDVVPCIVDGEEFENDIEQELPLLFYTRALPNKLWNPLYVPFKIPYEKLADNYDVAYINSMHSYDNDQDGEIEKMTMEVIKIKKGVLKANHPYLIRAKSDKAKQMDLFLENVTLFPTVSNKLDCSSVYTHFEITGTYKRMTRGELGGRLVITTDGAWKKLAASSILKPFRFYLTITDREGSPLEVSEDAKSRINICVQGEDDFATGIDEVKGESGLDELDERRRINVKTAVYDLSGRRVQNPSKGGVYIVNGKKVVF